MEGEVVQSTGLFAKNSTEWNLRSLGMFSIQSFKNLAK